MSAVADLGTRPLRVFGPVLLAAGVLMLVIAGFLGVKGFTSVSSDVLVEGAAGTALTLPQRAGAGSLRVLASTAGGQSTTTADTCELVPSGPASQVSSSFSGRTVSYQGREYRSFKSIGNGWQSGAVLTCKGPHLERVLVARDARAQSLLPAGLFAFAGLGGVLLGAIGMRLRR